MTPLERALTGVEPNADLMLGLRDLAETAIRELVQSSSRSPLTGDERAFLDGGQSALSDFLAELERIREMVNKPPD